MTDSWDDYASDWDTNPDVKAYAQLAYNCLQSHLDLTGLTVLDFGCGTGLLTERLVEAGADVVALDSSQKMIEILSAKSLSQVEYHCDLMSQEFLEKHADWKERFDLIVASSVLSFVPDYSNCLSLLTQCLKQGGKLIQWDWFKHDNFGFDETDIHQGFLSANLDVININPSEFIMESKKGAMPVIKGYGQKN